MKLDFFLQGLIMGLSIAAPVGPVGVLCIRRTLANGRAFGFLSGVGAATADAFYGSIAAFGLTFVSGFLIAQQAWLRLVGGLFLCYLALRTFRARVADGSARVKAGGLFGAYASTVALTLTNPMTIISFAAVFAGLGIGSTSRDYASAVSMVAGVFCGSALWWLILSGGVGVLRGGFGPDRLVWVNRLSGMVIGIFGLLALLSLFVQRL